MQPFVVVGHDGSQASRTAVRRARQLSERVLVLSTTPADDLFGLVDGDDGIELRLVPKLHLHELFEAAAAAGPDAFVVMPLHLGTADKVLRLAMQEVAGLSRRGVHVAALHLVRAADGGARPYRRILAAADGSVGSAAAAVTAARIAAVTGAALRIVSAERRLDPARRESWDSSRHRNGDGAAASVSGALRRRVAELGVDASWVYVRGDPARSLLDAISGGGYGLLVSGVHGTARKLVPTQVNRTLMTRARVDHLLVFDPDSLADLPRTRTAWSLGVGAAGHLWH